MSKLLKPNDIKTEDDAEAVVQALHKKAEKLVRLVQSYGMNLTIETSPREPLAMGNFDIVVTLRAANELYRLK